MKQRQLILGILVCTISLFVEVKAQSITLSFTGIKYGRYVPIDSILIVNFYAGCDTTLYYPSTSLTINTLGSGDHPSDPSNFIVFQNVPNPSGKVTTIRLFQPAAGEVSVVIANLRGRQVASFSRSLQRGFHLFEFTPGGSESYLFSAFSSGSSQSIKIVSGQNTGVHDCVLQYAGVIPEEAKSKPSIPAGGFSYTPGDHVRYTGYCNTYTSVIDDAPLSSTDYTFLFSEPGTPCPGVPTLVYGGQTYHTVLIGNQCWLKENLNIGTMIPGGVKQTDNGIIEKYCSGNLEYNCEVYGGLYQWNEVMQYVTTQKARGICPEGWHIPAAADWQQLANHLGGNSVAGGILKEAGTSHWYKPNYKATNSVGFTALPTGRWIDWYFTWISYSAWFWTSTLNNWKIDIRFISHNNESFGTDRIYDTEFLGVACRCIKD